MQHFEPPKMETPFKLTLKATQDDIDFFHHVNNAVYLNWLISSATAHSDSVGYTIEKYVEGGAAFVVRRHELDYLASAVLDDEVEIETWIADHSGATTTREYRIKRISDQKMLMTARSLWVYVNLKTGRPLRIPKEILRAFNAE